MAALHLDGLTLGYDRHPAVHHLSGCFPAGSLTAIAGPNGAGKSTLLKGIKGMLPPLSGRVDRGGLAPSAIAYLPQQADLDPDFPITVHDVVLLGHWRRIGPWGRATVEQRHHADQALAAVGLDGFSRRPMGSLSTGQRQRVLFARLLLEDAAIILLDEPFAAIDARTTADLLTLMTRWHGQGRTIIAVLHDFDQIRRHFPHCLLLARRPIGWGETATVLSADNLRLARSMDDGQSQDAEGDQS